MPGALSGRRLALLLGVGGPRLLSSGISVSEDAALNTVIGTLSVAGGEGTYTFTITSDPDSKFQIANDDELQLAAALDYETDASHLVTIEADNGVDPPINRTLTIAVTNVDDSTGAIADLEANMNGNDIELLFTPATDAVRHQYRWHHDDPPVDGTWTDLELIGTDESFPATPDTIYFQVRGVDAVGGFGPASNSDPVTLTDLQAPQLVSVFPENLAVDTQRHVAIATFDEALVAGDAGLKVYLYDSDDDLIEEFDVVADAGTGAGQIEFSGVTFTIRPTALMEASKGHYILWDEGAFKDAAGNLVDAVVDNSVWSFTTDAAPTTFSLLTSAISTDETITIPASVQAGDLLVLNDVQRDTAGGVVPPNVTPDQGFDTQAVWNGTSASQQIRNACWRKVCVGGEAGAVITGLPVGTNFTRKILLVFRADNKISQASRPNAAQSSGFTTSDPAPQVIPTATAAKPSLALATMQGLAGATISPRSCSPAASGEVNNTNAQYMVWKTWQAADTPTDVTVDMDDEGTNFLLSNLLELS